MSHLLKHYDTALAGKHLMINPASFEESGKGDLKMPDRVSRSHSITSEEEEKDNAGGKRPKRPNTGKK